MMPEMDGVETLHHMKALGEYPCKNTTVISLTANAIQGAKEMYLREGFDDFLSKPIQPEKLEKMIKRWLPKELLETEEYRAQFLEYEVKSEYDETAYGVYKKTESGYVRIKAAEASLTEYHCVYLRTSPANTDILNPAVVEEFIRETHEEYYKRFKKYFDNGTITSAFYDKPSWWGQSDALTAWGVQGGRMWTDDFDQVFAEMFGEDINPVLYYPALWEDVGEKTAEARDKINAVRTEMFAKHYVGRLNDWCKEHGIELMGHMLYEDIPNPVPSHGDLMYCFKYQDCPTLDVIASYQMTEDCYKIISSAANSTESTQKALESAAQDLAS
jgi:CheY-like chemotaxis protein